MEFFSSNDKPDQLWRKNPEFPEGSDGPRWTVFFIADEYQFLLKQERFNDIPDYGIRGSMKISGTNDVISAFEDNPTFDETKFASCSLLKQ